MLTFEPQAQESTPVVLIVDDNEKHVMQLCKALGPHYQVIVSNCCKEGLAVAHHLPQPDVIVIETVIRDQCGYELCRALNGDEETKKIPVILITNDSNHEGEELGLENGAFDFVRRPLSSIKIIQARIRNALKVKRSLDRFSAASLVDGLTGAHNRISMTKALLAEWKRSFRTNNPISVMMIDIDHFKLFNDRYGHPAGDECLRSTAKVLQSGLLRMGDVLYRYGGEEFAVILPDTRIEDALVIGERLRSMVEQSVRSPDESPVTVSIGCATASGYGNDTCSPNHLFVRADRQLYNAKENGRNRVCSEP